MSELGAEIDAELGGIARAVAAAEVDVLLVHECTEEPTAVVVAQPEAGVVAELGGVVRRHAGRAVLTPPRVVPAERLGQAGWNVGVDPGPAKAAGDKGREGGGRKVVGGGKRIVRDSSVRLMLVLARFRLSPTPGCTVAR